LAQRGPRDGRGGVARAPRVPRARLPARHRRLPLRSRLGGGGRHPGGLRPRVHSGRPLPHHAPATLRHPSRHPRQPSHQRDPRMKILVMIKQVPDTATQVKIGGDGRAIDAAGITWIVSPYDEFAVEEALRIKEKRGQGEVVAVSLGPERGKEALRSCLAMGADRAIHLNDPAWNDADTLVTSKALAAVVKQEAPQH